MEMRKGPYGQYLVETATGKFNKYATEIIAENVLGTFIRFYAVTSPITGRIELSYDCTDLLPLSHSVIQSTDRGLLRKAVGDLFLSFIRCLDLLIPLTGIVWSESYLFWDNKNSQIKLCIAPYITDVLDLSLSSLGNGQIESILNSGVFSHVLSGDEISALISAIESNDEESFEKLAFSIKNSDPAELLKATANRKKKFKYKISFVGILILLSILGATNGNTIVWGIGCFIAIILMVRILTNAKENNQTEKVTTTQITTDRKNIFFDEVPSQSNLMSCLILKSQKMIKDKYINKALYSSKSTIGSDPFLSDICIEDALISEIHVEITKEKDSYYVVDLSRDNSTYIDNRRIDPGKQYEIKNGQILRCGEYDFEIVIE